MVKKMKNYNFFLLSVLIFMLFLIFDWLNFKRIDIDYIKITLFSLVVVLAFILLKEKITK